MEKHCNSQHAQQAISLNNQEVQVKGNDAIKDFKIRRSDNKLKLLTRNNRNNNNNHNNQGNNFFSKIRECLKDITDPFVKVAFVFVNSHDAADGDMVSAL